MGGVAENEVERKFSVPVGGDLVPPESLGEWAAPRQFDLDAEYFDTPTLALTRAGWSLRRRTGGGDEGWHLKSPRSGDARVERRVPLAGSVPPASLRREVGHLLDAEPLIPVARLITVREEHDLLRAGGGVRAHLCHDRVRAEVGDRSSAWSEVEVELAPDEPRTTLDAVAAALAASGCGPAEHSSKVARALALRTPPAPTTVTSPANVVLAGYLARQVGSLQAYDEGVRSDAPDAVHKSRVAARRLRSVLKVFAPVFSRSLVRPLAEELRWYGLVAGASRDLEVLAEHVAATLADLSGAVDQGGVEQVLRHLAEKHSSAHGALVAALETDRYAALQRSLADFVAAPPLSGRRRKPTHDVVGACLAKAIGRVRRRADAAQSRPHDLAPWHEVRKAAKAVRYACEALAEAYGPEATASAKRWEAVTEALGDAQDTVVASEALTELAGRDPGPGLALLVEQQVTKRIAALDQGRAALVEALDDPLAWLKQEASAGDVGEDSSDDGRQRLGVHLDL